MKIKRIVVQSSAGRYSVVCGAGVLRHAAKEISKLGKFSSVHIVSSAKVWRAVVGLSTRKTAKPSLVRRHSGISSALP